MTKILNLARSLHNDDSGAAFIEYTVLLGVILAVGIAAVVSMGLWANRQWVAVNTAVGNAPAAP